MYECQGVWFIVNWWNIYGKRDDFEVFGLNGNPGGKWLLKAV